MLIVPPIEEPSGLNDVPVLYWNHVGLEMNRLTHSLGGPQGGPTMSSRALGLLHLAMHDAFFGALGNTATSTPPTYLPDASRPTVPTGLAADLATANLALCGAAVTVLDALYATGGSGLSIATRTEMTDALAAMVRGYPTHLDTLSPAYRYGKDVAWVILDLLAVKPGQIGADEGAYQPRDGRFYFRDEPGNPVRLAPLDPNHPERGLAARRVYHGPFYGMTVPDFAVTDPEGHRIAEWPRTTEYRNALREVYKLGGAPDLATTTRSPDQTVAAYYWAYDGANLIGTPPRLYNQILRVVAWDKRIAGATPLEEASDFVRLFALANVAMSDAGKYAWKEKYRYELWRPLTGIREHDTASGPAPTTGNDQLENDADPFWRTLGAPNTNTNRDSFKPPFPAYPSGHATFGAAAFQMARLFYADRDGVTLNANRADDIEFSFVSEELNGINRDLVESYDRSRPIQDQPGLVRTRVVRSFPSLWHAIFENGLSRVFLGVHWRFDAFDARDALRPNGSYKDPGTISYRNVWTAPRPATVANNALPIGGIPLGLGIANDIFGNQMKAPASAASAMSTAMLISAPQAKASNTTYA